MSRGGGGRGGRGGRGGMAGKSFNREQLNAMGIGSNDVLPGIVTAPPPLYPILERHPVPLTPSLETDYLLILKQDFIDHMQLSASYIKAPENKKNKAEQEIDKLVAQLPSTKEQYDWSLFPAELRPKMLAKRLKKKEISSKDVKDVAKTLDALEKLEKTVAVEDDKDKDANEEVLNEDNEIEDEDEEMDDGTDYANNYFDNGEDYDDEDDNLDDGPVY